MDDLKLFEEIVDLKRNRRPAVLATVTESRGSVPRKAGARMLIRVDGTTLGTIGGGPVERAVIDAAPEILRTGRPSSLSFSLTEEEGYVCGGSLKIFLEAMASAPRLLVIGNGHIGRATGDLARTAGFDARIIDWVESPALPEVDDSTAIIVATREHELDFEAVCAALQTEASFIGLLGSRRKRTAMVDYLLRAGFSEADERRVTSPVGLPIGAQTPEEIAVSIVAQLIEHHRKSSHECRSGTAGGRPVAADGKGKTASARG